MTIREARAGIVRRLFVVLAGILLAGASFVPVMVALPGGEGGIGFDDLGFSPALHRLIVPGGRTGKLFLIDPDSSQVDSIEGFSASGASRGHHSDGITSADAGLGKIFATDRTARLLDVIDPASRKIIASAHLASGPDYVRVVPLTNEVWVTEPHDARIEVFALSGNARNPAHAAFVGVHGGPESLVIDGARGRAYTNLWADTTVAIELKSRQIVARWPNGCRGSRGLAVDSRRGFLLVGCEEGALAVIDVKTGRRLSGTGSGSGVDIIAYDESLGHAYLPGAESATMAIVGIADSGASDVLEAVETADGAHCAAADNGRNVWVCDPKRGRLLEFRDPYPASS